MAKITLGSRPKNFEVSVTVPLHEGLEGTIRALYRYRTRTEFGQFVDDMTRATGVAPPASATAEDVAFSLRQSLEAARDKNAEYLLQVMDGWDLEPEFNLANVRQMCDELPGVALALIERYRAATLEGRLGN